MHFRRQAPIGRYIVDFVCHRSKIVVELDGSQHGEAAARAYDEIRTVFLSSRGYRILRFADEEVFRNRDYVIDAIARFAALEPHPNRASHSSTSPLGGGDT
jgi:very-short-patch-repair endonuclease